MAMVRGALTTSMGSAGMIAVWWKPTSLATIYVVCRVAQSERDRSRGSVEGACELNMLVQSHGHIRRDKRPATAGSQSQRTCVWAAAFPFRFPFAHYCTHHIKAIPVVQRRLSAGRSVAAPASWSSFEA